MTTVPSRYLREAGVFGSMLMFGALAPAGALASEPPGILLTPHDTAVMETGQYPPEMRVGSFEGRYGTKTM